MAKSEGKAADRLEYAYELLIADAKLLEEEGEMHVAAKVYRLAMRAKALADEVREKGL